MRMNALHCGHLATYSKKLFRIEMSIITSIISLKKEHDGVSSTVVMTFSFLTVSSNEPAMTRSYIYCEAQRAKRASAAHLANTEII